MKSINLGLLVSVVLFSVSGFFSCRPAGSKEAEAGNRTLQTIFERKSVRNFTSRKASPELLDTLVRAGMAAPTGRDIRPWEFIIITNRSTLDTLAALLPYAKMLSEAPAAIVVCGREDKENGGSSYWYLDCSAATENILLAAEALGLGAVWTAAYPYEDRMQAVEKVLDMPQGIRPLNVIPVGYPRGSQTPKVKYDPSRIHRDRW